MEELSASEIREHQRKCREIAATKCTDNIYEQIRVRIVRVMREHGYIEFAAEDLGVSVSSDC